MNNSLYEMISNITLGELVVISEKMTKTSIKVSSKKLRKKQHNYMTLTK